MSHRVYTIPDWVVRAAALPFGWRTIWRRFGARAHVGFLTGHVTVDWDGIPPTARHVANRLGDLHAGGTAEIEWRASASRRGVHLRVYFGPADTPTDAELLYLRESLGDDPIRLAFDTYRYGLTQDQLYLTGILFDSKMSQDGFTIRAGPWHPLVRL